jgi:peptidoglycan hydrolase-like amidase
LENKNKQKTPKNITGVYQTSPRHPKIKQKAKIMEKKSITSLFAVMTLLLLIPFGLSLIEKRFYNSDNLTVIRSATAATANLKQIEDYIAAGYIGKYGLASSPPATSQNPYVLGVATTRTATSIYEARETNRSAATINLKPGQAITVWVDFLNTGTTTWYNSKTNYLALAVTNPSTRKSPFWHIFWKNNFQLAHLTQKQVRPGQTGRFRFAIQAPQQTGTYVEEYQLVKNDGKQIDGGYVRFLIGVGEKVVRPDNYQAAEIGRSNTGVISLKPGQGLTLWVDMQNTGLKTWYSKGQNFLALNVTNPAGRVSLFKHDFWKEYYYRPGRLQQSRVYPGQTGRFRFAIQAPAIPGYYSESFSLVAENLAWVTGGTFIFNFKVGDPTVATSPTVAAEEPIVRIGLYNSTEAVSVTANGPYNLIDGNTNTSTAKVANEISTVNYSDTAYWRFVPNSADTIVTVTSFNNQPSWNKTINDNTFRGNIEVRYSTTTKKMWIINELPVESYLRGLAEVTNGQPPEYLKSLISAARSYVIWHHLRGGKHVSEYFDINSTTDQVYRGYGFEQRSIDPLKAVQDSSGVVITHPDAISQINPKGVALAPYSSGTDGRTRSWQEVWDSGGYPWILSVADPYGIIPNYGTLSGNHMVGMSAQGARGFALKENKTYDWILKHYYTGANVEKIY